MTEEVRSGQTTADATSAVPSEQQGITGGARDRAERTRPEINRYLYENLASNVESQIEHWNRRQPVSRTPIVPGPCAPSEGLGYALRLLSAFEPEFRELTDAAIRCGPNGRA